MQKSVWNLLNFSPYWLYGRGRQSSLWYSSMRLFRQEAFGDWERVFQEVEVELGKSIFK